MKAVPKHTLDFIDSWLRLVMKWEDVPGLSVAIAHKGKVIFAKAYGVADVETGEVLTPRHRLRYASHSKSFTATALLQLKEKGRLRLDDKAIEYLPWLKEHKDDRWQDVTIRQLMSHGAGVIRDGNGEDFWSLRAEFPDLENLKQWTLENDLVLEPNSKMKYSNFGYGLLGQIIVRASGKTYAEYVTENIIRPLGLENTSPEYDGAYLSATGYSRVNLEKKRFAFPQISTHTLASATGFSSTPSDMVQFFAALALGSGKLLKDSSKREMQHAQWKVEGGDGEYGLGLDLEERDDDKLFGHSGGFPGFRSRTWHNAARDLTVSVVVTSPDRASAVANSILATIVEFGDKLPEQKLLKFEQRFVTLHGVIEVVAHAGGLRKVYPNSWWPMSEIEKLKVVNDTTLQLYDAGSFGDEGEKIVYEFNQKGEVVQAKESEHFLLPSEDGDLKPWW